MFLNEEECPGIKRGGVLNVVRREVELICPADSIPEKIELDLLEADIGDSLHYSHAVVPDNVEPTITDRDFTIATIAAPSGGADEDEEAEGEEGVEGEEGAEAAAEGGDEAGERRRGQLAGARILTGALHLGLGTAPCALSSSPIDGLIPCS